MEKRYLAMWMWLCEGKLKWKKLTSGYRQRLKTRVLKVPNNYLLNESKVLTGKCQTETLILLTKRSW